MRAKADAERVERFMEALGAEVGAPGRVYLTGGATAVLPRGLRTRPARRLQALY